MKQNPKIEKIVDCGLLLLKTEGDYGVTMRQVAVKAEMSLSNVQYYFKNKDELLKAMADRYFNACIEDVEGLDSIASNKKQKQALSKMLKSFLSHGLEISEMCHIFREYWAIATRNEEIQRYLRDYYVSLSAVLADKLRPLATNENTLSEAVSIIIPYVEGYSITALSMPKDINQVADILTDTVLGLLKRK
ncbi:MAG: TetR/AcrR family transcriptional regulator [Candidatus Thiodiazotropha sp.]